MNKIKLILLLLTSSVFISGCTLFKPKKAGLQVITNSVGASVFIDGQYLDKTPFIGKEFKPGTYTLRIEPDDSSLVAHETSLTLTSGLLSVVTWKPGNRPETSGGVIYEMEKIPKKNQTKLSVISIPDGAIISVDGGPKEFTPLIVDQIEPGQHEFEVSLPSYETQKHTINVIEGHQMNITVNLAKNSPNLEPTIVEKPTPATTSAVLGAETATSSGIKLDLTQTATTSTRTRTAASPKPTTTPSLTPISGPTVTILPTNFFQENQEVLRVRAEASSAGAEVGFAIVGQKYKYLNQKLNGWFKIDLEGKPGWVSGQYSELNE